MGKKAASGQKVDLRGLLAEPAAPKAAAGPAWAKGAGAAARAPPPSASAPPKAAPKGPALSGSWAKGGPKGLAATATSVQAQAKYAPGPRPKPAAFAAGLKPGLGLKRDAGPAFDSDDFAPLEKPKDAAQLAEEKTQASVVAAFPSTSDAQGALRALCEAAGIPPSAPLPGSLDAALGWLLRSGLPQALETEGRLRTEEEKAAKAKATTPDQLAAARARTAAAGAAKERVVQAGGLVVAGLAPKPDLAEHMTSILEAYFAEQQTKGKNTPQALEANGLIDAVLNGTLALHLEDGSPKIPAMRMRLLRRLLKATTPAAVQRALADALAPLVEKEERAGGGEGKAPGDAAADMCLEAFGDATEGVRRGAALGAAAVARACGAGPLRKRIIEAVEAAIRAEGKSASGKRQGGLFCFAELAAGLGRSFEPQALKNLPLLLSSCADDKKDVHEAGRAAVTKVVAVVSVNGLKMMVKPVLEGIRDKRWRTQLAAIDLLRTMVIQLAESAAKRLAMVLPQVVPALCEAAASARGEIRDGVRGVLESVGGSIGHRDVATLAPQLIEALCDPTEGPIATALESLLSAVYTTAIDGAACALICPVIERALTRGDADAQQKAASFARGLVLHAGESEELTPYFAALRDPLQALLSHPNPGVREAAAQAVGSFAAAPTQDEGVDASSKLLEKLDQQQDGAEMEGTAQGIAATMSSVSDDRRTELLAELLREDAAGGGRLARLCVLAYLPKAMAGAAQFCATLSEVLPALERALSDPDEAARGMARRAFGAATEAVKDPASAALVAKALRGALRAENLQARAAAAELTYGFVTSRALAADRAARAELVAAVVVAQSDPDANVRRIADRVWRAATEAGGPPGKQLKELRPQLLERIGEDLAGGELLPAKAAGRAAAQLHERLDSSGGLLEDLVPVFAEALAAADPGVQRGACAALAEVLRVEKCAKAITEDSGLPAALRDLLYADAAEVRAAAAACAVAGPAALVAEPLAAQLCGSAYDLDDDEARALEELVRADATGAVLRAVVAGAASATPAQLCCLRAAAVARPAALRPCLGQVAAACAQAAAAPEAAAAAAKAWAAAVGAEGARELADALLALVERGRVDASSEALAGALGEVLATPGLTPSSVDEVVDALLPGALAEDERAAATFSQALQALVQSAGGAAVVDAAAPRLVELLGAAEAGALAPAALDLLAPLLSQGLAGSAACKAAAAQALAGVCRRAAEAPLQAHALKCAGPLVRALADQKPAEPELPGALLGALEALLDRAGAALKPLVPALLTALLKVLDGAEEVRPLAAQALAALARAAPKVDVVVKAFGKAPIKAPAVEALAVVFRALPTARAEEAAKEARAVAEAAAKSGDEAVRSAGVALAAALDG